MCILSHEWLNITCFSVHYTLFTKIYLKVYLLPVSTGDFQSCGRMYINIQRMQPIRDQELEVFQRHKITDGTVMLVIPDELIG